MRRDRQDQQRHQTLSRARSALGSGQLLRPDQNRVPNARERHGLRATRFAFSQVRIISPPPDVSPRTTDHDAVAGERTLSRTHGKAMPSGSPAVPSTADTSGGAAAASSVAASSGTRGAGHACRDFVTTIGAGVVDSRSRRDPTSTDVVFSSWIVPVSGAAANTRTRAAALAATGPSHRPVRRSLARVRTKAQLDAMLTPRRADVGDHPIARLDEEHAPGGATRGSEDAGSLVSGSANRSPSV